MLSTRTAIGLAAATAGLAILAGCGSSSSGGDPAAAAVTAFKNEYAQNASKASKAAVVRAQAKVNAECPGAAS